MYSIHNFAYSDGRTSEAGTVVQALCHVWSSAAREVFGDYVSEQDVAVALWRKILCSVTIPESTGTEPERPSDGKALCN